MKKIVNNYDLSLLWRPFECLGFTTFEPGRDSNSPGNNFVESSEKSEAFRGERGEHVRQHGLAVLGSHF